MLGVILALAIVFDSRPMTEPAKLIEQLGSPRYSSREMAGEELVILGQLALPLLKLARDSKDAEIRNRSIALVARIETAQLFEATLIPVDFRDVSVAEAITSLNCQSGSKLSFLPEDMASFETRRLTSRQPGRLPFWKALDFLRVAGNMHLLRDDLEEKGVGDDCYVLVDGHYDERTPTSDHGPFRVQLKSFRDDSEMVRRTRNEASASRTGEAHLGTVDAVTPIRPNPRNIAIELLLSAEPRLSISRNGRPKLTEVLSDRGLTIAHTDDSSRIQQTAGYYGMSPVSTLRLRLDLDNPESNEKKLGVLKGTIPVVVATRRPDPLSIRLLDSCGKSFRTKFVVLTLIDQKMGSDHQPPTIQLAIEPTLEQPLPLIVGSREFLSYRPDSTQQQVEVVDGSRANPLMVPVEHSLCGGNDPPHHDVTGLC